MCARRARQFAEFEVHTAGDEHTANRDGIDSNGAGNRLMRKVFGTVAANVLFTLGG